MDIRKFKSDKAALIVEGKYIASSSDDAKFLRKVTIVNLMLGDMKAKVLAEECGETDRTLSSWVKAVDEHGFEALRAIKQPRRPYKRKRKTIRPHCKKRRFSAAYSITFGRKAL